MLTHIHIRDFAIIEELELELYSGMTALTGETGAGKSILLDAIGLVLGDKATTGSIRHGAQKAEITLSVDVSHTPTAQQWLNQQALDHNDEAACILRRVIAAGGKSRAWINGTPVTLALLRELGEQIVDIHGQHEHQSLMKRDMQRQLLDDYAGHDALLKQTHRHWQAWKTLNDRLQTLSSQSRQHQARLDLLNFQSQELEALALESGEPEALDEELNRLANAEALRTVAEQGHYQLYEDEQAIYSRLSQLSQDLTHQAHFDTTLNAPLELIHNAQIQLQEAALLLRDYAEGLELDPERLQWVESRIADIRAMARKYRMEPPQLIAHFQAIQTELAGLSSDDYDIDALQQKLHKAAEQYHKTATKLSKSRQKAAAQLGDEVSSAMQQLGMQGGFLAIQVTPDEHRPFHPQGMDQIEFVVSTNPGQPLKPLVKVASGGELSRISLAIQMAAAQKMTLPALIFDEVDTGIGGGIAEVVGQQLRVLGTSRQVLCVTHLPQVASQAHHHYKIIKQKSAAHTQTGIHYLQQTQRTEEIARMMGGKEMTAATLALAEEMLYKASDI